MAINREWHEQNPMPPKATLAQRIRWHVEHAKHCDCRPMPESIADAIEKEQRERPSE
jgi:hypothetical protein